MSALTSTMHRSHQTRGPHTPSSYQPRPTSQSTIVPSSSSPRRPSVSNTMHWLSRSSTQATTTTTTTTTTSPYSPSKPIKVSEPKLVRSIDIIASPRSGALGSGATIVRTPDEALRETGVRLTYDATKETPISRTSVEKQEKEQKPKLKSTKSRHTHSGSSSSKRELISPPTSPPLPPLPLPEEDEDKLLETGSIGSGSKTPPRPSRAPPAPPVLQQSPSKRSSMKVPRAISIANSSDEPPTVPPLPPHIAACTQPPPFSPILITEPPSTIVDASKLIVTMETCTTTFKTTLSTLTSRPSHMSDYFSSLFRSSKSMSVTSSVYSTESDHVEMYRQHLTSQGLVPISSNVHIFLDRPSAPYAHILTYLRTPVIDGQPEVIPRALQLQNMSSSSQSTNSHLDALIEVRDEAAYLNLEGLHKLCTDEIRHRYGPRLHHRGHSASSVGSIHSLHASVYSLHTLLERVETDIRNSVSTPAGGDMVSSSASTPAAGPVAPLSGKAISIRRSKQMGPPEGTISRSPPTPQSWDGPLLDQQRSQSRSSQRSRATPTPNPPAGWI